MSGSMGARRLPAGATATTAIGSLALLVVFLAFTLVNYHIASSRSCSCTCTFPETEGRAALERSLFEEAAAAAEELRCWC